MKKSIVISGPSGTGKTVLAKTIATLLSDKIENAVSATIRKKRDTEVHAEDYYFLSNEDFMKKVENGEFIEWQSVYNGFLYGTPYSEMKRIQEKGKIPLFEIEVVGAKELKEKFGGELLSIFILPGGKDPIETLRTRLIGRGTEDKKTLTERLTKARWEIEQKIHFDRIIPNEEGKVEETLARLKNIIEDFLKE